MLLDKVQRLLDRNQHPFHRLASLPKRIIELFGQSPGQGRIVVGDHDNGRPHLLHVGIREPQEDAVAQDAWVFELGIGKIIDRFQMGFVRTLTLDVDDHGQELRMDRRSYRTVEDPEQHARSFESSGMLIQMGVGSISRQSIAGCDHLGREVRVRIEGCNDRNFRTHQLPKPG